MDIPVDFGHRESHTLRAMMKTRALLLLVIAACGGKSPSTTPAPSPNAVREVRLLEADDPALSPVLFAAAKFIFNPDSTRASASGFGGVYINKRYVAPLSREILSYLSPAGAAAPPSRPADCDAEPVVSVPLPRPTIPASQTGGDPNPPAQPKRTTAPELCNRGGGGFLNFTSVRIASDTAYVEIRYGGVGATKCLPLSVDAVAGGWVPVDRSRRLDQMKTSKLGRCGK